MKILKEFTKVQKSIAMDWIIKLLLLREFIINIVYNSILIIIDKFIKYIYFLLYIEELGIENLAY